ncbi:CENP-B N-terminal DNA-binding domain [Popillia japonica]|uniref:CENP-B N-terminal DNA-binding domain n=1 Tax=Popillia japonica TaxID=7064 RepID=A0AAW1J271_POPJA
MEHQHRSYARFKYSEDDLDKALDEIKKGILSLNAAAKKHGISKSTFHNRINEKVPNVRKMGPQPVLNGDDEARLKHWIHSKAKLGFPMHPTDVKDAVQKILKATRRSNPFDRPGDKWLKLYLKRKPEIVKRNTEIISKSSAAVIEIAIRE